MDRLDGKILDALQRDASLSIGDLANKVGLSTTPCWRRVQALEKSGLISGRVALVNPEAAGLKTTVFVALKTSRHDGEWLARFAEAVQGIPEVVEIYRMAGDVDYLLKVLVADIAGYDRVYKKLISRIELSDVSSSFAMEVIKRTTVVPLDQLPLKDSR